mgnify:CR=1 FL=1
MQTHLHGRDMITTQEWTKDELDTIIDVALDLRKRIFTIHHSGTGSVPKGFHVFGGDGHGPFSSRSR